MTTPPPNSTSTGVAQKCGGILALAPPSKVINVVVTVQPGSLTLTWGIPRSVNPILFYNIKWKRSSEPFSLFTNYGTAGFNTLTIPNLMNGVGYDFMISAVNGYSPGPYSDVASGVPGDVPGIIYDITSIYSGNTFLDASSIALQWTAPNDNGYAITTYRIKYKQLVAPDASYTYVNISPPPITIPPTYPYYKIVGLTLGQSYVFNIAAINARGIGLYGSGYVHSIGIPPYFPPDPSGVITGNIEGVVSNNRLLTFSWGQYNFDISGIDLSGITGYKIQYTNDLSGANKWNMFPAIVVDASVRSIDISYGILNGTNYFLRYAAINEYGEGNYTNNYALATGYPGSVPKTLDYVNTLRGNMTAKVGWGWYSTLSNANDPWNFSYPEFNGGYPILGYDVYRYNLDSSGGMLVEDASYINVQTTTIDISGLVNGVEYLFKVKPRNILGLAPNFASNTVIPVSRPFPVVSVQGTTFSERIVLQWVPPTYPAETGGLPIRYYFIEYREYNLSIPYGQDITSVIVTENMWNTLTTAVVSFYTLNPVLSYNISGLVNGKYYIFRVAPVTYDTRIGDISGAFVIDASNGRNSYTVSPLPVGDVPSGVTNLAGTIGDGTTVVSWGAPTFIGSNSLLKYTVRYKPNTEPDSAYVYFTTSPVVYTYTIGSLLNGTQYKIQVYATNIIGSTSATIYNDPSNSLYITPGRLPNVITLLPQYAIVGVSSRISLIWPTQSLYDRGGYPIINNFIQQQRSDDLGNVLTNWVTYSVKPPIPISQAFTSKPSGLGDANGFPLILQNSAYNTYLTTMTNSFETTYGGNLNLAWRYGGTMADPNYNDGIYNQSFAFTVTLNIKVTLDNTAGAVLLNTTRTYDINSGLPYKDISGVQYVDMSDNFSVSALSFTTANRLYFQFSFFPDGITETSGLYAGYRRPLTIIMKKSTLSPPVPYIFDNTTLGIGTNVATNTQYMPLNTGEVLDSSFVVTGLTDGYIYNLRVASQNRFGITSFSNFITKKCGRVPYKIGASIENLYASVLVVSRDANGISVLWNPPASGGYDITSYIFSYCEDVSGQWLSLTNYTPVLPTSQIVFNQFRDITKSVADVSTFGYIITNYQIAGTSPTSPSYPLNSGKRYYVKMAAVNDLGTGEFSDIQNVIVGNIPGPIRDIGIIVGNNSGRLVWRVPQTDNGYPILDYAVEYKSNYDIGFRNVHPLVIDASGNPQNILPPAPIESLSLADPSYVPIAEIVQTGVTYTYTSNLFTNEFDASYIGFTWKGYNLGGITRQTILRFKGHLDNSGGPLLFDVSGTYDVSSADITYRWPITPNRYVTFTNRMYLEIVCSDLGNSGQGFFTLNVRSYSITGIAPLRSAGLTGTKFTFVIGDDQNPLIYYDASSATPYLYYFRVTPKNAIDYAIESTINDISNVRIGTDVSAPVTDLSGVEKDGEITLHWGYGTPNLIYDFYVAVDEYKVNRWPILPDLNHSITTEPAVISRDTSGAYINKNQFTISQLTNGQIYYFSISPQVVVSQGGYSTLYNAPPSNTIMVSPGAVPHSVVSIAPYGDNGVMTLTWIPGTDPNDFNNNTNPFDLPYTHPILSYAVQYSTTNEQDNDVTWNTFYTYTPQNPSDFPSPGSTVSTTITGLTNEVTYYFRVLVTNNLGRSRNNVTVTGRPSLFPYVPRDFTNFGVFVIYNDATTRYNININYNLPLYNGNALNYVYTYEYTNSLTPTAGGTAWWSLFDTNGNGVALLSESQVGGADPLSSASTPLGGLRNVNIVCKSGLVLSTNTTRYLRFIATGYITPNVIGPVPAIIDPIIVPFTFL